MNITFLTLAVVLCLNNKFAQARFANMYFPPINMNFDDFPKSDINADMPDLFQDIFHDPFETMNRKMKSMMPPIPNLLNAVCDGDAHACVQRGVVGMSSSNSNDQYEYFIAMGDKGNVGGKSVQWLQVKKVLKETGQVKFETKVYPKHYIINNKDVNAWDLRPFTKNSFTLKVNANKYVVLTYYAVDNDEQPADNLEDFPTYGNVLSINF